MLIYVKDGISFRPLYVINRLSIEMIIELSAIILEEINVIIVSLYSPSTSKNWRDIEAFFDRLGYVLEYLCKLNFKVIICGDFNIDLNKTFGANVKNFKNCFTSFGLYAVNDQITRPNPRKVGKGSCIDNVVTNFDKNDVVFSVVKTWVSDHWALYFTVKNVGSLAPKKSSGQNKRYVRSMRGENISAYINLLSVVDWHSIYCNMSADSKISMFLDTLDQVINDAFPLKVNKNKTTRPKQNKVYCPELNHLKELSEWFYDLYISSGLDSAKSLYNKYKKIFRVKLKEYSRKKNDDIIMRSDNKSKAT